jgi:hypothetical protein
VDPAVDDLFERQLFEYVFDIIVGANNVQQPGQLQILSDADFEWWWNKVFRTNGLLKLLMKEQATGRDFIGTTASATSGPATFNGILIDLWGGQTNQTGAFPLAIPYIMPATRVYTLLLTDLSAATNTVQIVFSGFKLWPRPKIGDTSGITHPGRGTASHPGAPSQGVSGYGYGYEY